MCIRDRDVPERAVVWTARWVHRIKGDRVRSMLRISLRTRAPKRIVRTMPLLPDWRVYES
eukprot:3036843-Amphidinium_carterae.2